MIIAYLIIGCFLAYSCRYTDGVKGIQAPGRFILVSLVWPVIVLYAIICLVKGTATFRKGN